MSDEFNAPMTAGALMRAARARLQGAGIGTASLDARLLTAHALDLEAGMLLGREEQTLVDAPQQRVFEELMTRRLKGEPVSHILGVREFWSLSFKVSPATLAPRPESETLIEAALKRAQQRDQVLRILDLGTGSGCLVIALLSELPRACGVAVDKNAEALAVARENAQTHKCAERISFVHGSWADGIKAKFDIIVSNPPYLSHDELAHAQRELRFEPLSALDGGGDGLDAYRDLMPTLAGLLSDDGCAILEIGAAQSEAVSELMHAAGLVVEEVKQDLAGRNRCIVARLPRLRVR